MRSFDVISRSCNGFFVRSILTDVGSIVVYISVLGGVYMKPETQVGLTFLPVHMRTDLKTQVGLKMNDVKCPFKDTTKLLHQ